MKNVFMGFLFCFTIILLYGCGKGQHNENKILPVEKVESQFSIDVYNVDELVGSANYMFIGEVEEFIDTDYINESMPLSTYKVQVLENIKGELKMDEPIEIIKEGGLSFDKESYWVDEDDILPDVGGTYLFLVYAQPDGTNLVSGPNSTIPLDNLSKSVRTTFSEGAEIGDSAVDKYRAAMESQVHSEPQPGISNDDINQ